MNAADPKVVQALQQATLLELFAMSTLIDRQMSDPARIAAVRLRLHLGQRVQFLDWRDPQMQMRPAQVVALTKDHVKVLEEGAHRQWNLPYAAVEPAIDQASPPAAPPAPPPQPAAKTRRDNFRGGERVSFEDRSGASSASRASCTLRWRSWVIRGEGPSADICKGGSLVRWARRPRRATGPLQW